MNTYAYQDIPFNDHQAFLHFMDLHLIDHTTVNNALLAQGIVVPWLPIGSENGLTEDWLNFHNRIHDGIDTALNITNVDFSFLDLKDESSYRDWLVAHYQQHTLYEQALGLT